MMMMMYINHAVILYLGEQGCEDPWFFSKPKVSPEQAGLGNNGLLH